MKRSMSIRLVLCFSLLLATATSALAQESEEAVVGYLGYLKCHETTSGAGDDDLNVVYGVLVGYTNNTFRTWGGYLHYRTLAGTRFERGPRLDQPLFVHSFFRTRQPTTIDTVVDQRQVRFVRVVLALHEYDEPWPLAQGRAGMQDISGQLRAVRWDRHAEQLAGRESRTVFGETLQRAGETTYADKIGRFEVMLTARDLANRDNAFSVASRSQLQAFSDPPALPTPANTRRDFRMTGDGSDYRGALWLTRGVRAVYSPAIADSSDLVPVSPTQSAYLLHNATPFEVQIRIALEGGRSVGDRLNPGQRKQYSPGNRAGEVPTVTVSLPDGLVLASPDFARFRSALRRLAPLSVNDGFQYQLRFRDTAVSWVRLP